MKTRLLGLNKSFLLVVRRLPKKQKEKQAGWRLLDSTPNISEFDAIVQVLMGTAIAAVVVAAGCGAAQRSLVTTITLVRIY